MGTRPNPLAACKTRSAWRVEMGLGRSRWRTWSAEELGERHQDTVLSQDSKAQVSPTWTHQPHFTSAGALCQREKASVGTAPSALAVLERYLGWLREWLTVAYVVLESITCTRGLRGKMKTCYYTCRLRAQCTTSWPWATGALKGAVHFGQPGWVNKPPKE